MVLLVAAVKHGEGKISAGYGLLAIPNMICDKMVAGNCIDLTDLPSLRVLPKEASLTSGNIWLIQAELARLQKRLIPDISTWVQCYARYMPVSWPSGTLALYYPCMMFFMVDIVWVNRQLWYIAFLGTWQVRFARHWSMT